MWIWVNTAVSKRMYLCEIKKSANDFSFLQLMESIYHYLPHMQCLNKHCSVIWESHTSLLFRCWITKTRWLVGQHSKFILKVVKLAIILLKLRFSVEVSVDEDFGDDRCNSWSHANTQESTDHCLRVLWHNEKENGIRATIMVANCKNTSVVFSSAFKNSLLEPRYNILLNPNTFFA